MVKLDSLEAAGQGRLLFEERMQTGCGGRERGIMWQAGNIIQ